MDKVETARLAVSIIDECSL
jgi:hypothetical protein